MAQRRTLVPDADGAFNNRFRLIVDTVNAGCGGDAPVWTHIPPDKRTELAAAAAAWDAAYGKTFAPHSKVETEGKNGARAGAERVLRRFIRRYFYDADDVVSDVQLAGMELPPHSRGWIRRGVPREHVALEVRPAAAEELRIDYVCVETGSRARPDMTYKGVTLYHCVLEGSGPPPPVERFAESELMTRSPYVRRFDSSLRGRRVALCAAWENGTGREGSRCPAVVTVIP